LYVLLLIKCRTSAQVAQKMPDTAPEILRKSSYLLACRTLIRRAIAGQNDKQLPSSTKQTPTSGLAFCFVAHLWPKFGPLVAHGSGTETPNDRWPTGPLPLCLYHCRNRCSHWRSPASSIETCPKIQRLSTAQTNTVRLRPTTGLGSTGRQWGASSAVQTMSA